MGEGFIVRKGGGGAGTTPPSITITSVTSTAITYTVTNNHTSTADIYHELGDSSPDVQVLNVASGATITATVVTSLIPSTNYIIHAFAVSNGLSPSPTVTASQTTNAPAIPTFTFVSETSSSITFTIRNNDTVTGQYAFGTTDTPTTPLTNIGAGVTTSNLTISGLAQSQENTIYARVRINDVYSASVSITRTLPESFVATGGTITTTSVSGTTYKVHTFTTSGTFEITQGTNDIEYLVIGGGRSGGGQSGGGGAGGYRTNVLGETSGGNSTAEAGLVLGIGSYTATVGGANSASTFSSITSATGGAPGGFNASGNAGASGGGAGIPGGGVGNGGAGTPGQGSNGGSLGGNAGSGGGGGAGAVGQNGSGAKAGNGGNGLTSSITGTAITRAGGGGGATGTNTSSNRGLGGAGGGGTGSNYSSGPAATSGDANTGGGGGGGGFSLAAGSGGSGLIVIRYIDKP
jgi:hypothetical protein